ncbi:uncharacterized protein LOC128712457 [Anopheles marshallii]|uniref:uncharacterized protein LOC128712457 n=1 Tax=Anopheles marshallii TaxID=1521116 RepID=UPI00237B616A|nr:uncharacterized protein LOC128712457 [Anopheles marshallii]
MYFITFSQKIPKFRRHPLQGLWRNVVIPFYIPQPSYQRSTLAHEAKTENPRRTVDTLNDVKYPVPEELSFLPDADTELCVEAHNSLKTLAPDSIETGSTTQCSSSDMEGSDSDDSDVTLNDFESYTCFENDEISLCRNGTPKKLMLMRRRLPSVKKQKYDYVQSKVKQYVKSKAYSCKT